MSTDANLHRLPDIVIFYPKFLVPLAGIIQHPYPTDSSDTVSYTHLKRILGVMGLGAKKGAEITLRAEGEDEDAAIEKLSAFLQENL